MRSFKTALALLFFALTSTASLANSVGEGLNSYSADFENADVIGTTIGDDWRFFVNVYESDAFLFNYGGLAPNGPQISAIVTDQGTVSQGTQQLSVYSDYECCEPASGHRSPTGLGVVETNVFQEQLIGGFNTGEQWTFSFDAKGGNIEGSSTAFAFVKIIDPNNGFTLTDAISLETTLIGTGWDRYSISLTIGDWAGQLLQFGFLTNSGNYEGSGIFYDNIDFSSTTVPIPGAFLFMLSGILGIIACRGEPR